MDSLAFGKIRSFVLSILLGTFAFTTVCGLANLDTPSPAYADDDDKPEVKPEEAKTPDNPIVHFFRSIGIAFGLLFAAMSVGMLALIIILLMDLRLGEAVPPAFVEEFTDMVNKRQFKQAYDLCRNESTFIARVLTAGMGRLQYGIEDAREAMGTMVESVRSSKDAWIAYLGMIGTVGPLLGLVGTVSGMIGAFKKLGEAVGSLQASDLAGEIPARPRRDAGRRRHRGARHLLFHLLQESPHQHLGKHSESGRRPVDADVPQLEEARRPWPGRHGGAGSAAATGVQVKA